MSGNSSKPDIARMMPLENISVNVETQSAPCAPLAAAQHVPQNSPETPVYTAPEFDAPANQSHNNLPLISHEDLPTWYRDNVYIVKGYRAVSNSTAACFKSWTYLHNETVNIFTHVVASLLAFIALLVIDPELNKHFPGARLLDRLVLVFYIFATFICMSLSVGYHTMLCHSEGVAETWLQLDILGVLINIVGGFESANYFLFLCDPVVRSVYAGVFLLAVITAKGLMMLPRYHGRTPSHIRGRLILMLGVGAFTFVPFIHALVKYHWTHVNRQSGMQWYMAEVGVLAVAAALYLYQLPERWFPGKFDILGASHQVFHVLIVVSAVFHVIGLLVAFRYNYEHSCPAR